MKAMIVGEMLNDQNKCFLGFHDFPVDDPYDYYYFVSCDVHPSSFKDDTLFTTVCGLLVGLE